MVRIISLQGPMAVGKTSILERLACKIPDAKVFYEDIRHPLAIIKENQWNKDVFEDYIKCQKTFILHELDRYQKYANDSLVFLDYGAEELWFYTINYPKTRGFDWPIASAMEKELSQLKDCFPDKVILLDADKSVLLKRKENDKMRHRQFFSYSTEYLYPLKRTWLAEFPNITTIDTSYLTIDQVVNQICEVLLEEGIIQE